MRVAGSIVLLAFPLAAAAQVAAPPPPTVVQLQQWFEAGQYDEVTRTAPEVDDPLAGYLAGASLERLGRMDQARQAYTQLTQRGQNDPWALIGRSAQALSTVPATPAALPVPPQAGSALSVAEQSARRAVRAATPAPAAGAPNAAPPGADAPPDSALAVAHHQLGLVQAHQNDLEGAAASFGRAVTASPSFAYAHYYAGLMYSRLQQSEQAAVYWTAFLKLAPRAPEADEVTALLPALQAR